MNGRSWTLVALLAFALAAAAPPEVRHKAVELDSLNGKLKEAIAKSKGSDELTDVVEITRGQRVVYRARLENAALKQARFVVFGPTGDVLREMDLTRPGAAVVKWENLPGDVKGGFAKKGPADQYQQFTRINRNAKIWYVGVLAKGGGVVRVDESGKDLGEEPIPAAADDQSTDRYSRQELAYDNLPGPVKSTIGQNGGTPESLAEAFRITRGEETFYRVALKGNAGRVRMLRISPEGKIESERNGTPNGKVKVPVDGLSGAVKGAIYRETRGQPPTEVWQVTEDGSTWYVLEQGDKQVGINDAGEVVKPDANKGR